ncbi:MAG TPA: VOC family protein [Candidatus Thermoplasmatota archaeon]|nr:VOC family protein [Candidatus Thermoplasmatota archaeon]
MSTPRPASDARLTLAFRNVARYVRDPAANLPLYEALGFGLVRDAGDMLVLRHHDGVGLVLHRWDERPTTLLDTALGFTIAGDEDRLRAHLEAAGWRLLRAPQHGDVGYFLIYGDLDGNPVNLVGKPLRAAPAPGTVRLVLRDGRAVAEPMEP